MERVKPGAAKKEAGNIYFPAKNNKFIRTGCTLLDCVTAGSAEGGWPLGRVVNIVGDKSVGKSLLAIEACANFAYQYPRGKIWYREAEAAFDISYAEVLGLPVKKVDFGPEGIDTIWDTIDDIFEDIARCVKVLEKQNVPGLYIIDSLDALTTRDEKGRDRDKGTYGTQKAKAMSELFRVFARDFKSNHLCVIIISQIRDKIDKIGYGAKYTRAGGKSLDFYASHVIYLSHIKTLTRTMNNSKRATAVQIKAKCTKNKISLPFRECEFIIRFGYGVDDLAASLEWLKGINKLKPLGITDPTKFIAETESMSEKDYRARLLEVRTLVNKTWQEVETGFKPKRRKYAEEDA